MSLAILYFFLVFCFAAMTDFTLGNFLIGMVVSFLVLTLIPQLPVPGSRKMPRLATGAQFFRFGLNLLHFLWDFFADLTVSNILIAWDVWTPRDRYSPEVIYVPVEDLSDEELTLLSSRITLTPGTLSIDVTEDRKFLIVHVMYSQNTPAEDAAQNLRRPIDLLTKEPGS